MITFACPSCKKSLSVKDEFAGKNGKCPHCKQPARVPGQSTAAAKPAGSQVRSAGVSIEETIPPRAGNQGLGADTQSGVPQGDIPFEFAFLAAAQGPDEMGRLGPYRVLKVLGAGGMGVVFQAEDPMLERKVALKVMLPNQAADESGRQRFLREAKTAAAFEHDNIVRIYQVGEDRGVPFIAMEFLKGESLDDRLKRGELMTLKQVVRIGKEAALGLAAAHKHNLVHRDIKPANLWLEEGTDRVKILDFGLARAASGDNANLTQSGVIIGTPAFMAPEQANGKTVDGRTDLFSLGCVMYRMCTGELPFQGTDTLSTLMEVASHDPKPPAEIDSVVPKPLSRLIMKLLAKLPHERAASATEVAEVLAELETSEDILHEPTRTARSRSNSRNVSPSGTLLERSSPSSKSLRDSIAADPDRTEAGARRKRSEDRVETATVVARPERRKKRKEKESNSVLLWSLIGGGAGLVALVGIVVAVIVSLNSGKGSSSSQQGAQNGDGKSGGSGSGVSGDGSLASRPGGSQDDQPPLPLDFKARADVLVQWPNPLPPTWSLAAMKDGTRLYSDRQQYYVTKFSKGLEGGVMLMRTSGDGGEWLPAERLIAKRNCNVYAVVQRIYLGNVRVPAEMFQKLAAQGWEETTETAETTSQGEDWQWKVIRKTVKKGDDIGGLKGINWQSTVFFVFN
jgi:serine/threonine protein kinase